MKKPSTKKTANKPGRPKAKETAAPTPRQPHVARGHNLVDPQNKQLFLGLLGKYAKAMEALGKAQKTVRLLGKEIKADGFTMAQIKFGQQLATPEGEATAKSLMADNLLAAAYIDSDLGEQLSLFMDDPRVPAVDRAYKEGQSASMKNEAASPKYDPDTDQYKAYMKGFHDHQESMVKKGMKKLDEKQAAANASGESKPRRGRPPKVKANAETAEAEASEPASSDDASSEPITRSEFSRRQTRPAPGEMH